MQVDDARTLTCQPDGRFGLILFSNNGIDAVSHDDRALVLRRALVPCRPECHTGLGAVPSQAPCRPRHRADPV